MTTEDKEELYMCVEIFDYMLPSERFTILAQGFTFEEVKQYIFDNYRDSGRQIWFAKQEETLVSLRHSN